jgi:CRP-like cAMP-binding protein
MANPLMLRLEQFTSFTEAERRRLEEIFSERRVQYGPGEDILREGDQVNEIHLVLSGLAARYKDLPDGSRQIMAFLVPGDLCDVEVFVLEAMDHSIYAVTETLCALVKTDVVVELLTEMSGLTRALWWSTMTDSAVLRERIIDHGRRDARERIAHLFYEMLIRFRVVGETTDDYFRFPVSQDELADATGLTAVHVSRTLRQLRDEGLIEFKNKILKITDPARLKKVARFNPNYLHLTRTAKQEPGVSGRAGELVNKTSSE